MGRHPAALGLLNTTACSCLFVTLATGVLGEGPLVSWNLYSGTINPLRCLLARNVEGRPM